MKTRRLFLCNTVYQVLVVLWMKHTLYSEDACDLIVTDHIRGGEGLAGKIRESGVFCRVFYAETLQEARNRVRHGRGYVLMESLAPYRMFQKHIPLRERYTDIYLANFDKFSQMLVNAMKHKNAETRVHVFEDGLSTYCLFEQYYLDNAHYYGRADTAWKRFLHDKIYRLHTIYGSLEDILVFNPDCMQWEPDCPVVGLAKMSGQDVVFKGMVNEIFDYAHTVDTYDSRYIFLEESFYADQFPVNDVELVEELTKRVGRENVMVKIHPRNPDNRFAKLGYKTNQDTVIPWEVILMNMEDISNRVLITVASSTILNPMMIFGMQVKAYSLYPCLDQIPPVLEGKSWTFLQSLFDQYSQMITICHSIEEIQ